MSQTYSYDWFGNLLQVGGYEGRTILSGSPTDNRLDQNSGLHLYDLKGNLTATQGAAFDP